MDHESWIDVRGGRGESCILQAKDTECERGKDTTHSEASCDADVLDARVCGAFAGVSADDRGPARRGLSASGRNLETPSPDCLRQLSRSDVCRPEFATLVLSSDRAAASDKQSTS